MTEAEQLRRQAGPCPACGALAAKPIIWGMPSAGEFDRTDVVFGGCCLPENPPRVELRDVRARVGELELTYAAPTQAASRPGRGR